MLARSYSAPAGAGLRRFMAGQIPAGTPVLVLCHHRVMADQFHHILADRQPLVQCLTWQRWLHAKAAVTDPRTLIIADEMPANSFRRIAGRLHALPNPVWIVGRDLPTAQADAIAALTP